MRTYKPSPQNLRLLAVALWLLGFALPTLRMPDGSTVPGASVFASGWLWLPLVLVGLPASAVTVATLQESPLPIQWLNGLLRRLGLVALIAAATFALGLTALLLMARA